MRRALLWIGSSAALLAGTSPLVAQTPDRQPAVLELASSTRAMGLGQAFQAAPDADAVFYNPALASRAEGFALGVHWLTDAARAFTVSAAMPWWGGGVAVGLQSLEYGVGGASSLGIGGVDRLLTDGPTAVSELAASLAFGREFFGVRVGAAARLVDQRVGGSRRQEIVGDVGLAHDLGPGTIALAVRHLGASDLDAQTPWDPPTDVTLGWSAYGRQVGPLDLGVATAVTRRDDGEFLYGGGVELAYWPVRGRTFVARIGGRTVPEGDASPVTFGGSYWGDVLIVDYAFQPMDGGDGLHRFTLGWR